MTSIRTLFLALGLLPLAANAQTYLECDFNEGIPADFTLVDGDQLSPSVDMLNLGFAVGVPWIALTPKGADNMAACSTSWYKPAGQSDDWMITPPLYIADDGAIATWRAQASDKKHRDGYAVYVACVGADSQQESLQWQPLSFTLDEKIDVPFHETVPYSVWIEHGNDRYTIDTDVTSYPRHVVCEEGTGTWCGWCVRGLVMLDSLKRNCGDWTIGIAAHSGDPMANDYIGGVIRYMQGGGFPDGTVNRLYKSDPGNFFVAAQYAFTKEPVLVAMQAQARLDADSRQVQADTRLWFADACDTANYHLGYTVIENNVHQPGDDGYRQHNSYAGGKSGVMGGYENLPDYVPAEQMWYQEVARGYVDDIMGVEGSVPTSFAADEELLFSKSFPLPDGILDDCNTELVVMLIDQTDGHIVNAVCVPLNHNEANSITDASLVADQAVYDLYGRLLPSSDSSHRGLHIVRQSDGAVRKILSRTHVW